MMFVRLHLFSTVGFAAERSELLSYRNRMECSAQGECIPTTGVMIRTQQPYLSDLLWIHSHYLSLFISWIGYFYFGRFGPVGIVHPSTCPPFRPDKSDRIRINHSVLYISLATFVLSSCTVVSSRAHASTNSEIRGHPIHGQVAEWLSLSHFRLIFRSFRCCCLFVPPALILLSPHLSSPRTNCALSSLWFVHWLHIVSPFSTEFCLDEVNITTMIVNNGEFQSTIHVLLSHISKNNLLGYLWTSHK